MKEDPSVLIIQTAFLGDVVLATALVESIHAQLPKAAIDFVVRKGNEGLLQGNPGLRHVYIFDKAEKYKNLMTLVSEFRNAKYDWVINVQRFATTGLMTALSGGQITIGFDKNPLSFLFSKRVSHAIGDVHEVTRNLSLLAPLGIQTSARPRLYPSSAQFDKVKQYQTATYVTVSPASVWFTKQWPAEQWIDFIGKLRGMSIHLLGAPGDVELCDRIRTALPTLPVTNLAGRLSLLESAALMAGAKMNFVNDSAPLHLASAMNAPVTAVFCSTVPDFGFGPLSDQSYVVQTNEQLDCRPCGLHGYHACPQGHFKCATSIRAEQLMAGIRSDGQ